MRAGGSGARSAGGAPAPSTPELLYFSTVTFSTLGHGDFRPAPEARLLAAVRAVVGNLHPGFLVGAIFYAIARRS